VEQEQDQTSPEIIRPDPEWQAFQTACGVLVLNGRGESLGTFGTANAAQLAAFADAAGPFPGQARSNDNEVA